ncbi:MAG TPA: glycosyltransferase family 4 protein [Bryobacteraceae bacterium]|nr:glycosyltransferase family 4 protein [Bryobacteraceae bacterium]
MKLLFLDQYSELGGAQQALLDTVDAVAAMGAESRVLAPRRGPLVKALQSRGVPVGDIPCGPYRSGSKSMLDGVRFVRDLRQQARIIREEIARENIELTYVNGPRLLPAAALAARNGEPLVLHVHNHLRGVALELTQWILRSRGAYVVGCSKSVVDPFRRDVADDRLHVIPNGVRDAGYREREFDFRTRTRIGIIGRISPEKGQMEFLEAAALLKHEWPNAAFIICGAPLFSGGDYFDAVRHRAREVRVELAGWQDDVSRVLQELDLLAVPSLEEGMSRIVLEAFSAGVPVIAFPTGGIPEAVVDGLTGFLTPERSSAALAARLREVMAMNPESLWRVAREARQSWGLSYSLDIYQDRITSLLEKFVSKGRVVEMPLQSR